MQNNQYFESKLIYYFFFSFDFCIDDHETGPVENLGQVVFGERIRSSPYKVQQIEESGFVIMVMKLTYSFIS